MTDLDQLKNLEQQKLSAYLEAIAQCEAANQKFVQAAYDLREASTRVEEFIHGKTESRKN